MCTVLLVEDNEATRVALADVLAWEGFRVVTSGHGEDARQRLLEGLEPCAILLDLLMPVMDGWTFLDWMDTSPHRDIPVVLITSLSLDHEIVQRACRHRHAVIAKCSDPRVLVEELRRRCAIHA